MNPNGTDTPEDLTLGTFRDTEKVVLHALEHHRLSPRAGTALQPGDHAELCGGEVRVTCAIREHIDLEIASNEYRPDSRANSMVYETYPCTSSKPPARRSVPVGSIRLLGRKATGAVRLATLCQGGEWLEYETNSYYMVRKVCAELGGLTYRRILLANGIDWFRVAAPECTRFTETLRAAVPGLAACKSDPQDWLRDMCVSWYRYLSDIPDLDLDALAAAGLRMPTDLAINLTKKPFGAFAGFSKRERPIAQVALSSLVNKTFPIEKHVKCLDRDGLAQMAATAASDVRAFSLHSKEDAWLQLVYVRARSYPADVVRQRVERQERNL